MPRRNGDSESGSDVDEARADEEASRSSRRSDTGATASRSSRKFELWLQRKDLFEKSLELLGQLDTARANTDKSENHDNKSADEDTGDLWKEVAVSLACTEMRLRAFDERASGAEEDDEAADAEAQNVHSLLRKKKPGSARMPSLEEAHRRSVYSPPKTLFEAWRKWLTQHRNFRNVPLTRAQVMKFTDGAQEYMSDLPPGYRRPRAEELGGPPGMANDRDEGEGAMAEDGHDADAEERLYEGGKSFDSLKWNLPPPKPEKGKKVRPMPPDQKLQNVVFLRECYLHWKEAREIARRRIARYIEAQGEKLQRRKLGLADPVGDGEERKRTDSAGEDEEEDVELPRLDYATRRRLEKAAMNAIGMQRMYEWVEADAEKLAADEREEQNSKELEAKQAHAGFVRGKDKLRIRLPPDHVLAANAKRNPQRLDFSSNKPVVRGKRSDVTAATTVDLMRGSGLKYVHALPGAQADGDLEKSRRQLMDMGYLHKDNFDQDAQSEFHVDKIAEQRRLRAVREAQMLDEKEAVAQQYSEWLDLKRMRDRAVDMLGNIDRPVDMERIVAEEAAAAAGSAPGSMRHEDDGSRGEGVGPPRRGRSRSTRSAGGSNAQMTHSSEGSRGRDGGGRDSHRGRIADDQDDAGSQNQYQQVVDHWLNVGSALKRVDRSLVHDWIRWSEGFASAFKCQAVWDYMVPRSCDLHNTNYSAVQDTFLKLLRPGVDYRAAFEQFFERELKHNRADSGPRPSSHSRSDPYDGAEGGNDVTGDDALHRLELDKRQMKRFLREIGIVLPDEKIRTLIDAFDQNNDGKVQLSEFLSFTGDKRPDKNVSAHSMQQRCVWFSTCTATGMPCAYSLYPLGPRTSRTMDKKLQDASAEGRILRVLELKNGEQRAREECAENVQRKRVLHAVGLEVDDFQPKPIGTQRRHRRDPTTGGKRSERNSRGGARGSGSDNDDDEYGDDNDFDNDSEDDGHSRNSGASNNGADGESAQVLSSLHQKCQYIGWNAEKRKEGLDVLAELSRANRIEGYLTKVLEDGKPPRAPRVWNACLDDPDVDEEDGAVLTTEVLLRWEPQEGDLVSFFSVEYGGPVTGAVATRSGAAAPGGGTLEFTEILRDPLSAEDECRYHVWVKDLEPDRTYSFRVRAFNGFGPGPYTFMQAMTRPNMPATPTVLKVTPSEVYLRWQFSQEFGRRMNQLRRVFQEADVNDDGNISREELRAILDDRHPDLVRFLSRVANSINKKRNTGGGASATSAVVAAPAPNSDAGGPEAMGADAAALSVFDMIETDDNDMLTWDEFERFFISVGWTGNVGDGGESVASNSSLVSSKVARSSWNAAGPTRYIVQACVRDFDAQYVDVLSTTSGAGLIKQLSSGSSYRFRVVAVNAQGMRSIPSAPVIVHTLLTTPHAPQLVQRGSAPAQKFPRQARLCWAPPAMVDDVGQLRGGGAGTALQSNVGRRRAKTAKAGPPDPKSMQAVFDRILTDWTGDDTAKDEGVSLELAFRRYDRDSSNSIDIDELKFLLEDLGVEPTDEKLREVLQMLDTDGSGAVSFEEFSDWWNSGHVRFTVKRSEGVPAVLLDEGSPFADLDGARAQLSSMPVTCYRGDATQCTVAGLRPNTVYCFRIRHSTPYTYSVLSPPLKYMTCPLPPLMVAIVRISGKVASIKWYPHPTGAAKYVVQMRMVENLAVMDAMTGTGSRRPGSASRTQRSSRTGTPALRDVSAVAATDGTRSRSSSRHRHSQGDAATATAAAAVATPARSSTGGAGGGGGANPVSEDWSVRYEGVYSHWTTTQLLLNTVYRIRVCAANREGTLSEPSEELQLNTLVPKPRGGGGTSQQQQQDPMLRPAKAHDVFTIECNDDIVVGDSILFTERLFVDPQSGKLVDTTAAGPAVSRSRNNLNTSMGGGGGRNTPRVNVSTMSLMSAHTVRSAKSQAARVQGSYVGERTVAAHVVKDNVKSLFSKDPHSKPTPRRRRLWLEVVWTTVSNDHCLPFQIKHGHVLQRLEKDVSEFEVFRASWLEEDKRKTFAQEWQCLAASMTPQDESSSALVPFP